MGAVSSAYVHVCREHSTDIQADTCTLALLKYETYVYVSACIVVLNTCTYAFLKSVHI
jgi:hypothetical protein